MFRSIAANDLRKTLDCLRWTPNYALQQLTKAPTPQHVILAVADHFEPGFKNLAVQHRRIREWCREFQRVSSRYPDADGCHFRHTLFYPAEQYHPLVMEPLLSLNQQGWTEIEIQLHHGVDEPDTSENTRAVLERFRDVLADQGCLSRTAEDSRPRYAFVHGNWALANSCRNRYCGVDDEMQVLSETGCYADMTLPSAPDGPQTSKINAIYECSLPLNRPAPHRRGRNLRRGTLPAQFPVIVQGPLGLYFGQRVNGVRVPKIENGEISHANPASLRRLARWVRAGISIIGRPEWVFVKLHCHGLEPGEEPAMFGEQIEHFLQDVTRVYAKGSRCEIHFATAREMFNIIYAACDGREGNPGSYRDYKLRQIGSTQVLKAAAQG